jgi:molecular chaperone HscB
LNYFALYEIPPSFHPDAAAVKAKYYELSRKYHPDRFANAAGKERAESLRMSALNNDAWKTLTNPDRTMAYLLKENGVLEEDEKYALDPDFLLEMMELNELVSEHELEPANPDIKQDASVALQDQLNYWQEEVTPLLNKFDQGDHSRELLLQIKDYYFRKKYLNRIEERMRALP